MVFPGDRRLPWFGPLIGAVACLAVAVGSLIGSAGANTRATTRIVVKIGGTSVTFSTKKVPVGAVSFVVTNLATSSHAFKVGGKATPLLKPRKTATLLVRFRKAGKVSYVVTGSRRMTGTISVSASQGSTGGSAELTAGKSVFKSNCSNCHILAAAGAKGTVGPNLDQLKLGLAKIVTQVTSGGRFMPPFGASAGGSLSSTQIKDVAAFVYAAEH